MLQNDVTEIPKNSGIWSKVSGAKYKIMVFREENRIFGDIMGLIEATEASQASDSGISWLEICILEDTVSNL